jgi:hypothetical protein
MGYETELEHTVNLYPAFACRQDYITPLDFLLWRLNSRNLYFCPIPKKVLYPYISSFTMAIIDLNSLHWAPPFNPFHDKQQKASLYGKARSVCKTTNSQNQSALSYNKTDRILKCKDSTKSITTALWRQENDGSAVGIQGTIREYSSIELV